MTVELGAITVLLALAAVAALLQAYRLAADYHRRLSAAEENIDRMTVQILGLKHKRHTMSTVAGIEDALAVAIDLLMQQEVEELRMKRLHEILSSLREGPNAYPVDSPAGKREPEVSKFANLK